MSELNYELFPCVSVPGHDGSLATGWTKIGARLREAVMAETAERTTLVVECYPGVDEQQIIKELNHQLSPSLTLGAGDFLLPHAEIDALVAPFLANGDPVFGRLSDLTLPQFFSPQGLDAARRSIDRIKNGLVLIAGCGARLVAAGDVLVYADLSRREAQLRQRRGEIGNLGIANHAESPALKYKRAFFVDWRVGDNWKRSLLESWDFVLDTHKPHEPQLASGDAVRAGLYEATRRPFRVVPFFDPAPWGGEWLRKNLALPDSGPNYGWGFDCVPEENSLLLGFGSARFEIPSLDLVFAQPQALLGEKVFQRFGAEFPIRFDFLDTMGGGNLSFQVHPTREYAYQNFGISYTQDESYYILDAALDARVYLGLKEGVQSSEMLSALQSATQGGTSFDADQFANEWPARRHDHFLIPAGTVHCSGRNAVVLEISATPYIFTFKLWDWDRLGLDGRPRPIHIEHGAANIQWERTTEWTRRNLVSHVEEVSRGDGWIEERTGLHESQFIETRRHWFTDAVPHDTDGGVNVLNLVAGKAAVVESPDGAFEPFPIRYAETFIVPAAVGKYSIRPLQTGSDERCATIKASVRTR